MRKFPFLLCLALILLSSFAAAKSFSFPHVGAEYTVHDDASIDVREELTFDFSGDFSFAYRDIKLSGDESVENFLVYEEIPNEFASGQNELVPAQVETEYGSPFHATWHYSAGNETKTFLLT